MSSKTLNRFLAKAFVSGALKLPPSFFNIEFIQPEYVPDIKGKKYVFVDWKASLDGEICSAELGDFDTIREAWEQLLNELAHGKEKDTMTLFERKSGKRIDFGGTDDIL